MSALKIEKGSSKHSAYNLRANYAEMEEPHTLTILVDNEARNTGIAVAMTSIFNEISGQKDKHNGSCYLRFITKEKR